MLTRKHFTPIAEMIGATLATARDENQRTEIYDSLYRPMIELCKRENPNFDQTRFAYAVGVKESSMRYPDDPTMARRVAALFS